MAREYRHIRFEQLRDADPHGLRSNTDIDRELDLEDLEYDIADVRDVEDVRHILFKLVEMVR